MGIAFKFGFGQTVALDSLSNTFAPDSSLGPSWLDSTRASSQWRSSARWNMASRDGVAHQNVSVRQSGVSGVAWEIQQADPGGLRRRSLAWHGKAVSVDLGDLGPWANHPLLEGTSRATGPRDSTPQRQILYGSGTHPNGIDMEGRWGRARLLARQRIERADFGEQRTASASILEFGAVSAGLRVGDSGQGGPATRLASVGARIPGFQLEAAWLDHWDSDVAGAVQARGEFAGDHSRIDLQFRHLSSGFRHDGLSSRWGEGTFLSIGLRRDLAPAARLGVRLDGQRDSTRKVASRTFGELRVGDSLLDLRMGGSWSENQSNAPRWSIGSRLSGNSGWVVPSLEFAYSDSGFSPSASARFGLCLRQGSQELSASTWYSPAKAPRWTIQHRTALQAGAKNLEFVLSATGGTRPGTALGAQGGLSCTL